MRIWPLATSVNHNSPAHTESIFDILQFRRVVDVFERKLERIYAKTPFYALAASGNSGVPLAGALSLKMGIPIIAVRKLGETTVTGDDRQAIGAVDCGAYLIVDDLISSGRTVNRIMDMINMESRVRSRPVGIALYAQRSGDDDIGHQDGEEQMWRSQNVRVPYYGITACEWRYLLGLTDEPLEAEERQLDLLHWTMDRLKYPTKRQNNCLR